MQMRDNDQGYKSRKLWFAFATSTGIALMAILASYRETLAPLYGELVGGLLGSLGLYLTGNIGARHVISKAHKPPEPPAEPPVA